MTTHQFQNFTAKETAVYRRGITVEIADGLEDSAHESDNLELAAETLAIADCLRETAAPENIYFSIDQVNCQTGEVFNGYGSLSVAVGTRLCPNYQAKQSSRWNRKIKESFRAHKITDKNDRLLVREDGSLKNFGRGVRLRFLTLTMPDLKCSASKKLEVEDRALVLFKKRGLWEKNVIGGYVSEEFTDGNQDEFYWHFHAHALVISKWLEFADMPPEWTDCVKIACGECGVEFPAFDSNGEPLEFLNVWIKDVATYAKEKEMSIEKAVFEISKYMAKGSDILNVPTEELKELQRLLHNRKMINSYGIFNKHKGKSAKLQESDAEKGTRDATDKPLVHKRTQLTATDRKETLVRIGTRMISEGNRAEWLVFLRKKMEVRRAFRRRQLVELNPNAVFFTLDGRNFSSSDFVYPEKPPIMGRGSPFRHLSRDILHVNSDYQNGNVNISHAAILQIPNELLKV